MTWIVAAFWVVSLLLLLRPFVAQKTGLETLDALDIFAVRQTILLCWLIFALHPTWPTGLIALMALLPRPTFKRGLILACLSAIGMTIAQSPIMDAAKREITGIFEFLPILSTLFAS